MARAIIRASKMLEQWLMQLLGLENLQVQDQCHVKCNYYASAGNTASEFANDTFALISELVLYTPV